MENLIIRDAVGQGQTNRPEDVKAVHERLMEIGKIPCYESSGTLDAEILKGIKDVQRHFMAAPDGYMSAGKTTHRFLDAWKAKPIASGVELPGDLRVAWDWVSPLLPDGSYCSSGYRSAERQRQILQRFFTQTYKNAIIKKYGGSNYDLVAKDLRANESRVLEMVRGVGQAIAAPGRSAHQRSKAIDVGGPSHIDAKQVEIIRLVAKAHPTLFSGKILKERNGCVHFEIR